MNKDIPYEVASGLCLYEAHMRQEQGTRYVEKGRELHDPENRGLIIAVCNYGDKKFESLYDENIEFILDEPIIWGDVVDGTTLFNKILAEKKQDYAILMDIESDVVGIAPRLNPKMKSRKKILHKIPSGIARFAYDVGTRVDTGVCAAETEGIESVVIKRQTPFNSLGGSATVLGKNGVERMSYLKESGGALNAYDVDIKRVGNDWNFLEAGKMDLSDYLPKKVGAGIAVGANPACKIEITYAKPLGAEQAVEVLPTPAITLTIPDAQQVKKAS